MCQFCMAIERAEPRMEQVDRNASVLAQLIGSHVSEEREREQVAELIKNTGINFDEACDLFRAGRMAGESTSAHLLTPLMQENTGMLRRMHVKLAQMAQLYEATPTVLEYVTPLFAISREFATNEVESSLRSVVSKSEDLGVRERLLTGEDKIEDMIDVEFAMIGERMSKAGPVQFEMTAGLLKVMGKDNSTVGVGRMIVESSISAFKKLEESGDNYIDKGDPAFLKLAAAMVGN